MNRTELIELGYIEYLTKNPVKSKRVAYYEDEKGELFAKTCTDCREIKKPHDFHRVKNGFRNISGRCKVCQIKYNAIKNNDVEYIYKPRNPKTNRLINTKRLHDGENVFQYLKRQFKEGKLIYRDGRIYSTYDNRGKGKWLDDPVEVGNDCYRGYSRYTVRFDGQLKQVSIHRLIYFLFNDIEEFPEGLVINHINGDKSDNRIENLELVTQKHNANHALDTGLRKIENNSTAKLTWNDVGEIREILKSSTLSDGEIGSLYGVTKGAIRKIRIGESWVRRSEIEG